jgi:3-hydroxybutyryl-CoA dehydratase
MIFKVDDKYEQAFVVTDKAYEGFIHIFKDTNPLHTDEQFATGKGFKGKVMHGNILSGFLSYFVGECLPDKNVIIHSQEIQFKNAVYLNDELIFEAKVTGVYESVKAIEFKFVFKNKDLKVVAKGQIQIGLLA